MNRGSEANSTSGGRSGLSTYGSAALLLALPLLLAGCRKDNDGDCVKSNGPVETQRRSVAPFRVLKLYDNVEVTVVQDSETYAEVRTGRNIQENIELTVEDGTLSIRNTSRCNWLRRYDVPRQVTLHTPRLLDVFNIGEKTLRTQGRFRQDTLFLHIARAGDIEFEVESEYLSVDQYELGDLRLSGQTQELHAIVGDLGSLYAQPLRARSAYIDMDKLGDGNAHVFATDFLGANVAGTGTLYYGGPPQSKDVRVTGRGKAVEQ